MIEKELGLFLLLAGISALTGAINPAFLSFVNLLNMANLIGLFGVFALGEGLVIITGGIDLSVGPMVSLGSVVAASTMQGPLGVFGGVLALLALGTGVGTIVGAFVAIGRYPAIIVTLALSFVCLGRLPVRCLIRLGRRLLRLG